MSEQAVFDALKYRIEVNEYGIHKYYNSANKLHRTNGPAVIWADGTKFWYQNGLRHRTDGPAIEWANGTKEWFQNGQRHCIDGVAIDYANGCKRWLIHGVEMSEAEFNQTVKLL